MILQVIYRGRTREYTGMTAAAAQAAAERYMAWFGNLLGAALCVRVVPERKDDRPP